MDRPLRVLTVGMKPAINEALAERGDLSVAALTQGETERAQQGDLLVLPYRLRSKLSMTAARGIREAIAETQPDLIQTYGSRPLAHTNLALAGRSKRPLLLSYRGIAAVPSRFRAENWLTYLSPLVDTHACESQACVDGLVGGGVPAERCFLAYNCLSWPIERPASRAALAEFDIPEDAFVVASVGNFRRVKGADILLEAAKLCVDLPNTYFLLLGEVRDPRVQRLAADPLLAPRVRLAGFRQGAMEIAAAADLFAMASRAEALCVALLEAMSLGLCPVVSDAGGMKEAVRDGVDGLVVPRKSPAALAEAIRSLHSNRPLVEQFGRSSIARHDAMFAREVVAERFASAYHGLLNGARRQAA